MVWLGGWWLNRLHIIYPLKHSYLLNLQTLFLVYNMPGKFWHLSRIDYRPLLNPGFTKLRNQTLEPPTGAEYNTLHQES